MRVVELKGDWGLDNVAVADRPEPTPGPGEVLVRVRAASLNFRDLLVAKGLYNPRLPRPLVLCSDGAGEVAGVGPGVSRWKAGDRVCGVFLQRWQAGELTEGVRTSALGGDLDGMLAEYRVLPEDGLVAVPGHLSFEEAATLPCAAVTAWNALTVGEGAIKPGGVVLVQGTGGVSLFALQFARLAGARVLATSGSDDKLRRAIDLGASDGVNYKANADWDKWARERTGGAGADVVVEVGGAGTLERSIKAVRAGGRVALIGVLSGVAGPVNLLPVLMKGVQVRGIYVGSRAMFEDMNRAIALAGLRPVVDRVFELADAVAALRHMEAAVHFGKIVVRV